MPGTTSRQRGGTDRALTWLDIRPPASSSTDEELEHEAQRDLFERAKPGAFVYPLVWLIVTFWSGMWGNYTLFAAGNMIFLVGLSALRIVSARDARSDSADRVESFRWLTVLILTGALHWGVASAWIIFSGRFDTLRYPFLIMLPAFGMGGTAVLGISNNIRIAYPTLILVPSMIAGTVIAGEENLTLVALASCAMAYVMVASRTSSADYWKAIGSAKIAAERAQQLETQSITDPLTGIPNRLYFNTYFSDQWTLCARNGAPLSVALIDLDHFKKVNDDHGHPAGDQCLRLVASNLEQTLREPDHVVTRYGGEEFVAILPGVGIDEATAIGARLVDLVARIRFEYEGSPLALSCSVGVASIVPNLVAGDGERLIAAADEALYEAKASGRNQVKISIEFQHTAALRGAFDIAHPHVDLRTSEVSEVHSPPGACLVSKYRLVTRSDFDGLVCAVLLEHLDMIDDILFVHPKDMQDGKVEITANDITTNLPYVDGVHLAFDHHESETLRNDTHDNHVILPHAPSAARVVWDYYGGEVFPNRWLDMMEAVDKADSAQYSEGEVLNPRDWELLNFIMDPRTGLGRFHEFRISNYQLMMDLIAYCKDHSITEILQLPDVMERTKLYFAHQAKAKEQIQRCSRVFENLIVLDLTDEETIWPANRFLIYALYPQCNISIHKMWGFRKQNTVFATGKSILDRSCTTNVGELMLAYGGGGHAAAGTCQIEIDDADRVLGELIDAITADHHAADGAVTTA